MRLTASLYPRVSLSQLIALLCLAALLSACGGNPTPVDKAGLKERAAQKFDQM